MRTNTSARRYSFYMNDKLKLWIERAEHWPEGVQEEAVASLQAIEEELVGLYDLSPEDRSALDRSEEDVRRGQFASGEQVSKVLSRHRRAWPFAIPIQRSGRLATV
jgi:hypothetical protein